MANRRRKIRRFLGDRRYKKLFIIAAEGEKTEPCYFGLLNSQTTSIQVKCIKKQRGSSPDGVLKEMNESLKKENLRKNDEAWLVVDNDQWTVGQLQKLHAWSEQANNRGLALSNPNFEFWLLLHFEEGTGIASSKDCFRRLKKYIADYDKDIKNKLFTTEKIHTAIKRAKVRDNPLCEDWPREMGCTTVYRLVERIMKEQ